MPVAGSTDFSAGKSDKSQMICQRPEKRDLNQVPESEF